MNHEAADAILARMLSAPGFAERIGQAVAEATNTVLRAWLLSALPPWIHIVVQGRCVAILHTGTGRFYVPAIPISVN